MEPSSKRGFTFDFGSEVRTLITDVGFSVHSAKKNGHPVSRMFSFRALWDTGASHSVITKAVAEEVDLSAFRFAPVCGVHGSKEVPFYMIDVTLPGDLVIRNLPVAGCEKLGEIEVSALIGMDIISQGEFVVSNRNGLTSMSFHLP